MKKLEIAEVIIPPIAGMILVQPAEHPRWIRLGNLLQDTAKNQYELSGIEMLHIPDPSQITWRKPDCLMLKPLQPYNGEAITELTLVEE